MIIKGDFMDTFGLIFLCVGLIGLVIFLLIDKRVEKYRKYALVLLPFVIFLLLYLLKKKQKATEQNTESGMHEFQQKIEEVKGDLKEITAVAEIQRKISEEKKEEDLNKLKEITQIEDKVERRRKLAEMVG
jgi:Ca2+/Na+ antiporter